MHRSFIKLTLGLAAAAWLTAAPEVLAATRYVSLDGDDGAAGTRSAPWRTLQRGVDALKPGDTLLIGPGIYREAVEVKRGGTASAPITIAAAPGARVVVSGADRLTRWSKVPDAQDPIYVHDWPHRFPIGGPEDLTHPGDKEHEVTGRAEQVIHEGRLLRQVLRREQLSHGTFYVDLAAKKLYVWLRDGGDPNRAEMEASTRGTWLTAVSGVSHVRVRGITFRYAANHAQRGAFAIGRYYGTDRSTPSRGWVVEDCVFERANASGASLSGDGHVFRRCVFQDNGQLGFGTSFCHNTRMEECGIYRNNTKGYSTGWEAGGLKVTMSRGFVFDRCRAIDNRGCGIWYDIGNEKAEVRNCVIADNDEAGIFYEISYGLHARDNLIVNNANGRETPGGGWGMAGITLSSSEDCVVENNILVGNRDGIAFREQDRSTPRIDDPDKGFRILNRNHVLRGNLVAHSQSYGIAFWMDTNFFGPHPGGGDANRPIFEDPKTLSIRLEGNRILPLAPGSPSYLYGPLWRPKAKTFAAPRELAEASGLTVTDRLVTEAELARVRVPRGLPADSTAGRLGLVGAGRRGPTPAAR